MLLHADNFSIYGDASLMLNGVYAEADCQLVTDPDTVSTGKVLSQEPRATISNSSVPYRYVLSNGSVQALGSCFRLWLSGIPSTDGAKWTYELRDVSNNFVAYMYVTANGRIAVLIDGGATYYTAAPAITANGWYHFEWKYSTTGVQCSFELRIEGVPVMVQTNVTCTAHNIGMVRVVSQNISRSYTAYMKDFVLWSTAGADNNDFLGTVLVTNLVPDGDVANHWAPSLGTSGWDILSNIPPINTEYLTAALAQVNDPYIGSLTALPLNTSSVKGIITYVRAAKTDGGDGSLQVGLLSGTADAEGVNRPITIAQTYWRDIFERDPFTNAPWTPGSVNLANIRLNRTV